jgi:hypothetical protein
MEDYIGVIHKTVTSGGVFCVWNLRILSTNLMKERRGLSRTGGQKTLRLTEEVRGYRNLQNVFIILEDGTDRFVSETSVTNYQSTPRNIPEDLRSHKAAEAGNDA